MNIVKDIELKLEQRLAKDDADPHAHKLQKRHQHRHVQHGSNSDQSPKKIELIGPPRKSITTRARAIQHAERLVDKYQEGLRDKSYYLALNELIDMTGSECQSFLKSGTQWAPSSHSFETRRLHDEQNATNSLPKSFSWLQEQGGKYLSPIKNQGTCGSCWAFAGVSVIESRYAIKYEEDTVSLSVEQVLACSCDLVNIKNKISLHQGTLASSNGCVGGMPFLAFEYMKRKTPHGLSCAAKYQYTMSTDAADKQQCLQEKDIQSAISMDPDIEFSYVNVKSGSEEELIRAVMEGPVTANVDAHADSFRLYGGGIYDAEDCRNDGKTIDHAIVVVGFGETEDGDKYWIIRNTWGSMWGENGYMRLRRTPTGDANFPKGPCNLYYITAYPSDSLRPSDRKELISAKHFHQPKLQ